MPIKLNTTGADLKFVKSLATNYKLVPLLERAIAKGDFEWTFDYSPKQGDDAWHPSGDCTPSVYDLYMKVAHPVEDDLSGLRKTFMVGHFWHQYLQAVMVREGLADPSDIERRESKIWGKSALIDGDFPEDRGREIVEWMPRWGRDNMYVPRPHHWATGSADVAPCEIPGHGSYLIDFKTMKSMDFRRQEPPAWAVNKWECQCNIYMDWFDLERALIVGINKDSPHDLKEFLFTRNQPLIDAIYRKWQLVGLCLDEGVMPPRDEDAELPLQGVATQ